MSYPSVTVTLQKNTCYKKIHKLQTKQNLDIVSSPPFKNDPFFVLTQRLRLRVDKKCSEKSSILNYWPNVSV